MKIAIFTNNYLPNIFGVSASIESFRKQFEKMGHTVYIFAPKTSGYVDENPNVFRYDSIDFEYKISFPLAIPYSSKITRILDELEIDIVHSQHPNLLGVAAHRWAHKKKVPLVFTWHTLYDFYTHFVPFFIPQKLATWWVVRNAVKYANKAQAVIAPTDSVKKVIQKWGVKNQNIFVIPTGVDRAAFDRADGQKIRQKYKIDSDKIVLNLVSRFTAEKNIEFLFESVFEVLEKNNDVVFLVEGKGNLVEDMKNLVIEKGLDKQIVFSLESEENNKQGIFAAGDIFVYASKSETQGLVIAEAMYSGLPIVAVDASGVSDQVINGANGFLVREDKKEFVEAVGKLIKDKELRQRFSQNSAKIARENYVDSICAEKMLGVYEEMIGKEQVDQTVDKI